MRSTAPIIELHMALAAPDTGFPVRVPLSLRLEAGDCAFIEIAEGIGPASFPDLCSGLVELHSGEARFLGHDWQGLPSTYADALRGRIGRFFAAGAWVPFLSVESNILLPALHHTRRRREELRAEALALTREFGLPGLPLDRPSALSLADLDRAALVRMFLGDPLLVVVEDCGDAPVNRSSALLDRIASARNRGAAIIWLVREGSTSARRALPASPRFRLSHEGVARARRAA